MSCRLQVALVTFLDGELVQSPEHLGVAYLAAELRSQGRSVEIFPTSQHNQLSTLERIADRKPIVTGFSLTTAGFRRAIDVGGRLRKALGGSVHLTAGGPLATHLGSALLLNPLWGFLDSLIAGEGEIPLSALVERLEMGKSFEGVPGIYYREGERVVCNRLVAANPDLDRLPPPVRDQLVTNGSSATARIASSRGCTARCSFCNAPNASNHFGGKVWRGRSPENVVDEIGDIYLRHGVRDFEFVDSTFEDPGGTPAAKQRIRKIAKLITERRLEISFGCCVQAHNWDAADVPLIADLKRSGLQRVLIGVESGSAKALAMWQKRSTPAQNLQAIQLFESQAIYVSPGFIMFHPHVTREDLDANLNFLLSINAHNLRSYCTRLEVYPGTAIMHTLKSENLLEPCYETTLNPFDYHFADPELGRLAYAMALFAGEEYAQTGAIDRLPNHLAFMPFDIDIHRQASWLRRRASRIGGTDSVEEFFVHHALLRQQMTLFNLDLFQMVWKRIRGGATPETAIGDLAAPVSAWYAARRAEVLSLYSRFCEFRQILPIAPISISSNFDAGAQ